MEAEVLPVEAHPTHWNPLAFATESAAVMPVSLNEPVGFMPWCFGEESIDAGALGATRQAIDGRVAFTQRYGIGRVGEDREQLAEAPDAALIGRRRARFCARARGS